MKVVLLIFIVLITLCQTFQDDEEWIDPTDMLNYDAASGKMVNQLYVEALQKYVLVESLLRNAHARYSLGARPPLRPAPSESPQHPKSESLWSFRALQSRLLLEKLKVQLSIAKRLYMLEKHRNSKIAAFKCSCKKMAMNCCQTLNIQKPKVGLPDESNPEVHYDAEVCLTRHMIAWIEKFTNDKDGSICNTREPLRRMLVKFKPHNEEEWRWKFEDYFGVDIVTLFMVCFFLQNF
ncbi:chloride channel CLIC 1 isoform X1 [Pelobates cultripes]|uniref:Chloride channel CLIC-like protein 1 n=1 Tax=Pelobates cultripes TaxID=61616 RepID=A0AAD1WK83_PELCU|nr:chloride channel CLIC 1 isoform X1 [Pelobates cultripes]